MTARRRWQIFTIVGECTVENNDFEGFSQDFELRAQNFPPAAGCVPYLRSGYDSKERLAVQCDS